jgi:hypothetical protein
MLERRVPLRNDSERAAYADFEQAILSGVEYTEDGGYRIKTGDDSQVYDVFEKALTIHGLERQYALAMYISAVITTEPYIRELASLTPERFNG